MNWYTVVLNRKYELRAILETENHDSEIDTYVASIEAETPLKAVRAGIKQALVSDRNEFKSRKFFNQKIDRDSYEVIVVFSGLPTIAMHGFQY